MRLEATVPDNRGNAIVDLAKELGMSKSQVIDEALALFLKAILEVRRGRRVVTLEPGENSPACEISTPTLAALEWARTPMKLDLPLEEIEAIQALNDSPPAPGPRLRRIVARTER